VGGDTTYRMVAGVQPFDPMMCDRGVGSATIWREHSGELIRYAAVLVGPDHAEDVLSAVVERVLRRDGGLASLAEPRPYLFKAVLNESRNHFRTEKRDAPWVDGIVSLPEVRPEVLGAVAGLPERQRAAVYLTYWRDLPVQEVAGLMGCRPGTVKRYLHLARHRLRGVLQP
jgi:RNA polymerase sigma factor (sigma-70 family)